MKSKLFVLALLAASVVQAQYVGFQYTSFVVIDSTDTITANDIAGLQSQMNNHVTPVWGATAGITLGPPGSSNAPEPTSTSYVPVYVDYQSAYNLACTTPGVESIHVYGAIYICTYRLIPPPVTVAISHEMIETMVDPTAQDGFMFQPGSMYSPCPSSQGFWLKEVADPVQDQSYSVLAPDGWVPVSDFVFPEYFHQAVPLAWYYGHAWLDLMGVLTTPLTWTSGGGASYWCFSSGPRL